MLSEKTALSIFQNFDKIKILVVGDIMFDHYIWGNVNRISPEAPVPVVHVSRESQMPGGAANVVNNLTALGVKSGIIGIIGQDTRGNFIKSYLKRRNVDSRGLIVSRNRSTTEKIRIVAHSQQVVRVDREQLAPLKPSDKDRILRAVLRLAPRYDAVILEDYGKGVIEQETVDALLSVKKKKKPLIVSYDPKKGHELRIKNIDIATPNFSEAESIIDKRPAKPFPFSPETIGKSLRRRWQARSLFLTLGEKGAALFEKGKRAFFIPTVAREVYDVSGAGDTVIAAATALLAAGATPRQAAIMANAAAGIVVEKLGTQTASQKEIIKRLKQ